MNWGEALDRTGEETLLTVRSNGFDVRPPPAPVGMKTATWIFPGVATSDARTVAVTCSALTYIEDLLAPLSCTTEPGTKPAPVTVSVKLGLPAVTTDGLMLVIVGTT